MTARIEPTIGRVVWYWPGASRYLGTVFDDRQPFSASIAFVGLNDVVNLAVVDHAARPLQATSVPLWDGEGERPGVECWQWMPYQKGQAAKTEALTAAMGKLHP